MRQSILCAFVWLFHLFLAIDAFQSTLRDTNPQISRRHSFSPSRLRPLRLATGYMPPPKEDSTTEKNRKIEPRAGDIVRYYDIDGGKANGELLVGRISFIQKNIGGEGSGWTLELTELENLGDGYFADYPARKKLSKKTTRDAAQVAPIAASFVRSENAYKVPISRETGQPVVRQDQYDLDGYEGPFTGNEAIDQSVVESDAIMYGNTKNKIFKYAAITGLAGTAIADLLKGTEDAAIYLAGVSASLLYLFLLSIKTDTIASSRAKFGNNIASLRFATPLLVFIGVALYNKSLGELNPVKGGGTLSLVTAEQYAAAILGFLTYRLPLFLIQIQEAFTEDDGMILPGSAGIALKLVQDQAKGNQSNAKNGTDNDDFATVLLVSGPIATGRSSLVRRFIEESEQKFIEPDRIDRLKEGVTFERFSSRDEILAVDSSGRYGITEDGILSAAKRCGPDSALIIDADVDLARKLTKISGLRIVGVWIGLNSVADFEANLKKQIENDEIAIPEGETKESVIRGKIREIVQEIEYGISSGVFEFTILNKDEASSLKELRAAAEYCFK